jgi:hypothetical protein
MAEIIASLEPGRYPTGQTLTVTFPPGSRKAIVTRTDKAPILTEVLAYDTGPITPNPPESGPAGPSVERPFLVVTQDGRGNVVYDGGFPKFYNISLKTAGAWPAALPSTFAALTAASKYMYNAFNFCASKSKVGNGNRKVLLINNADRGYDYYMLGSHFKPYSGQTETNMNYGFRDTFDAICAIGGWEPTYHTYTGSMIDLSYDELDQYTHIVYISSQGGGVVPGAYRCTENFANNVATYRAAGNGVIIITDHTNYNFTSVEDALARSDGFVPDANRLAAKYDCYFSGNVNRSPVNVGEIRRQIGLPGPPENHPLLANLSDSEYIFAGGSESVIFPKIYTDEVVPENQPLVVPMLTVGTYRVNVLIQLENGDILTKPMLFTIIDPSAIQLHDSFNRPVTPTSQTYKLAIDYSLHYLTDLSLTLTGEIRLNGVLQGYFRVVNAVTTYMPFAGADKPMAAKSGDVITMTIKEPFEYNESITLNVPDGNPYYSASGSVAGFLGKIRQHPYFANIPTVNAIMADLQAFSNRTYSMSGLIGPSANQYYWKTIGKGRLPFTTSALVNIQLAVYSDAATWNANKPAFGNVGDAVIVADSNTVYYWENLSAVWVQHPQLASALFGIGRNVKDTRSNYRWYINANTTNIIP